MDGLPAKAFGERWGRDADRSVAKRTWGEHWIAVAGDKVFDPSIGRKYRSYSEIPCLGDAILVGEPLG